MGRIGAFVGFLASVVTILAYIFPPVPPSLPPSVPDAEIVQIPKAEEEPVVRSEGGDVEDSGLIVEPQRDMGVQDLATESKIDEDLPKPPTHKVRLRFQAIPRDVIISSRYLNLKKSAPFHIDVLQENIKIPVVFSKDGYKSVIKKISLHESKTFPVVRLERDCKKGRVALGALCCWPGQYNQGGKCAGHPTSCPPGKGRIGQECLKPPKSCSFGKEVIEGTAECCWQGQSVGRHGCYGVPSMCPADLVLEGEDCKGEGA